MIHSIPSVATVNPTEPDDFTVEFLPPPENCPGSLADLGIELEPAGPDVEDAQWWADQNGSEPDYDALADDARAIDAHQRGLCFA